MILRHERFRRGRRRAVPAPSTMPAAESARVSSGKKLTRPHVSVSNSGAVEIHVSDANWLTFLRMLSLQSQTNILPSKEVKGTVTANLYDVTVREALDASCAPTAAKYRERGNVIYVYSRPNGSSCKKSERVRQTEVFRLFTPRLPPSRPSSSRP